jgi:hypothetical protein
MKKALLYFALLLPYWAYSQGVDTTKVLQDINANGYRWVNGAFRGYFIIPKDTPKLRVADSGAIAYKGGDQWLWNGHYWKLNSSSGGGSGSGFSFRTVRSSAFSSSDDCPIPALDGADLQIFWIDLGRFLVKGTEWTDLAGGGFTVTVPGFNSSSADYGFTVYSSTGSITPGPMAVTSLDFSTSTQCPIPSLNGMALSIFWNDLNRYLIPGTEWSPLAGGGFTVLIPGFDASTTNYSFYLFNQ